VPNETIYVGFSTHVGRDWKWLVSWAIRKFMGTPYSHVYVRIPSASIGRDLIYEASGTTVHFSGGAQFAEHSRVVKEYELSVTPEAKVAMFRFAIDNLEKPYGTCELVGFAWVRACARFGWKVKNPCGDKGSKYVCSELVAAVLEDLGYDLGDELSSLTPRDVDEFLASKGFPAR